MKRITKQETLPALAVPEVLSVPELAYPARLGKRAVVQVLRKADVKKAALAVGGTFAFLQVNIVPAITIIGCTTFVISIAGVYVGNVFGSRYKSRAELTGGVILILIGLKILLEHLGVIAF